MSLPVVAIVGRANVGKSTLFNRLAGWRQAIVEDLPGTTRDRIYADASWQGRSFTLVDTGGLEVRPTSDLLQRVRDQVEVALAEADAILFLVDGQEGLNPADQDIAERLRPLTKPVLLVANKMESPRTQAAEFYRLGLGDPIPISAYHAEGTAELLDRLLPLLPPPEAEEEPGESLLKVAIVGRPNVGKSLLLNRLLGQERAVVSELPGTTRDTVDTLLKAEGQDVLLIDTAGLRPRGKVREGVERYSVLRALRAIARTDVVLLVTEPPLLTTQDLHIASYAHQTYKGLVVVVNKWDLVKDPDPIAYGEAVRARLVFIPHAPVLFTSALLGWGIDQVLPAVQRVFAERLRWVSPRGLERVMAQAVEAQAPPSRRGAFRLFSARQVGVNPPVFVLQGNRPRLPASYLRYLEHRLRQAFGFAGTPLKFQLQVRRQG